MSGVPASDPRVARLSVVGLGLIGGSVARGARRRGLAGEIVAVSRTAASLAPARAAGIIDRAETELEAGLRAADLVVLCAPVGALPGLVRASWPHLGPDALLTDVGSVKHEIVAAARACPPRPGVTFVGGHPMAGSERSGWAAADGDLFEGRLVLLTPATDTPPAATARLAGFWEALGAHVRCLTVEAHDRRVALISHLPHLAAYGLVSVADDEALAFAARGFADTTRIAASAEALWTDIFRGNRAALLEALGGYRDALARWHALIRDERWGELEAELGRARAIREKLG